MKDWDEAREAAYQQWKYGWGDPEITKFKSRSGEIRSHNQIAIGYYRGDDSWPGPWFVPDGTTPTHWMPLPSDPEAEVGNEEQDKRHG